MYVLPCPKCSRMPKIHDYISKNNVRNRIIYCPNHCSLPHCFDPNISKNMISNFMLEYIGDGDDNAIFKMWNEAVGGDK